MTTTPMKSALVLAFSLSTLVACEKKNEGDQQNQAGKEGPKTTGTTNQAGTTGTGGQAGGHMGTGSTQTSGGAMGTGQTGADGNTGTFDQKVEKAGDRIDDTRKELGNDTKAALDRAETRLNDLEARITKAGNDAKTSGREMSQELSTARATAKARAEAARQATADKLDDAIKELNKALDDLDKQIKDYEAR